MPNDRGASGAEDGATAISPFDRLEGSVALFVDTQNLYYAARDGHGAHVDYARLLEVASRGRPLRQATAYVVERDGERSAYAFVTKLSALGFRVRRRNVRVHRVDDEGRTVMEGDWDMQIAADLVRASEHVDVVALATGDGDFVPIVHLAQERGVRVEVLGFRAATSQALVDVADRYVDLATVERIFVTSS